MLGYCVLRIEAELVLRQPAAAAVLVLAEVEQARGSKPLFVAPVDLGQPVSGLSIG
jgi:hypothetical protein